MYMHLRAHILGVHVLLAEVQEGNEGEKDEVGPREQKVLRHSCREEREEKVKKKSDGMSDVELVLAVYRQ